MKKLRTTLTILPILFALTSVPRLAHAELFGIWGSGLLGGAYGNGKKNQDFFRWAGGGAVGVEAGIKILFLGAYIDYLRFFGGKTGANLVGFNLGGDSTFSLTDSLSLVWRLAGTYYIGTLDDKTEVANNVVIADTKTVPTQGVGIRGGIGLRYTFFKVLSVGVTPQVGYHYFFHGEDQSPINTDDDSHGWDINIMAYLRFGLGF